jgi:hypothetical protein
MAPVNVPFSKANLASHVLWMCPHQWQDQYTNLYKKSMTPMDMLLLQASLKAIECMCTQERAQAQSGKKASHKSKAGTMRPSNGATRQVTKKFTFEKSSELYKKYGGAHTTHIIKQCCKYKIDGTAKPDFHTTKKASKKPNPAKQSFAQLSKKLDKLKKTLQKVSLKSKKCHRDNSNSRSK